MSAVEGLVRDREFERRATREICGELGIDIEPLVAMAERRADQHESVYGHDFPEPERNLEREAVAELLDARNYLVWKLDRIRRGLEDGNVEQLQLALRYVALAFVAVRRAETCPEPLD